jgi:hypothetical protein
MIIALKSIWTDESGAEITLTEMTTAQRIEEGMERFNKRLLEQHVNKDNSKMGKAT